MMYVHSIEVKREKINSTGAGFAEKHWSYSSSTFFTVCGSILKEAPIPWRK
jgi:hypothetical protein